MKSKFELTVIVLSIICMPVVLYATLVSKTIDTLPGLIYFGGFFFSAATNFARRMKRTKS